MILDAERQGFIHGCRISRSGPTISHLLFADDSLLFCKAKVGECEVVKQLLRDYEDASGQSINLMKSGILFSGNLEPEQKEVLASNIGITNDLRSGNYLGLPSLIGKKKRDIFNYLKGKLWKKFQGWHGKFLSKAGREILLKAVAQALPSYCMNLFLLPKSTTEELQHMMNSFWWGSKSSGNRGIKWISWDRLCARKINGGMGFKNLQYFNLAMLGKQTWNLIANPNSLMARVLKSKYFSNSNFLEANLGHNPSFLWRSLWSSRAILKRGVRWRIGDGNNISVWRDPWLRDPSNFYISSPPITELYSMKVSELFIPFTTQWNHELLYDLFENLDVQKILNIHVHTNIGGDKLIWHHGSNGKYTVRSGYQSAQELLDVGESIGVSGDWKKLWNLKIPPKVKVFLWRAARDILPNRGNLQKRQILVPISCATCGKEWENSWHQFIFCPLAKACWEELGTWNQVLPLSNEADGFVQWLFKIFQKVDVRTLENMAMVLWGIWRARNDKLWNKIVKPAESVVSSALQHLSDWRALRIIEENQVRSNQQNEESVTWKKPQAHTLKCNVDASVHNGSRNIGVGMVLRGSDGLFISAKTNCFSGSVGVKDAEAMAFKEALSWIESMNVQDVIFELDSKIVVEAISSERDDNSEFGAIISDCRGIIRQRPLFRVCFTRRQANKVAHNLARESCFYARPSIWTIPPDFILDALNEDSCNSLVS